MENLSKKPSGKQIKNEETEDNDESLKSDQTKEIYKRKGNNKNQGEDEES